MTSDHRLFPRAVAAFLAAALVVVPASAADPDPADLPAVDPQDNPYNAIDGKVDQGTYNGFRRYHASCHTCHGPAGNGSSFAPALKESVKDMAFADFLNTVVNGRQVDSASGQRVMPAFGTNPNVMNHINDIWGYLKARADGAVGPGRPKRIGR